MGAALWKLALVVSSFFVLGGAQLLTDICGEINGVLRLPGLKPPHHEVTYGNLHECICFSHLSSYIATNPFAIAAAAGAGKPAVTAAINEMFNSCERHTCHYPPYSVPACAFGFPCSFTCTDGFIPFPIGRPTQCVCNKPYTICNGKCGLFKACSSGHPIYYKRGLDKCASGYTSCPIPGRGGESEECVNTQTDLESCGGCIHPATPGHYTSGVDCTAIQGIADVSCIHGQCVVYRCMSGYTPTKLRDSCIDALDESEIILGDLN